MTDLEIAEQYQPKPIGEIAERLGIKDEFVLPYGKIKAKITAPYDKNPKGKLILVTAVNPTPLGEGKTTVAIGLADGIAMMGKKVCAALREPSLGPVFGLKGGATGGGYSQVVPMADINLHFNGDFHAITAANNLLSALIDNHIKQGLEPRFKRVVWRRCLDVNDRALREVEVGLGGRVNGVPRIDGFDITAASEIMAIFCLADGIDDLKRRLGNIIVGFDENDKEITARQIKAENAMTILLADALYPNLVQTLGGTPALIHGGPFANIAHGCNSVIATKTAMTYSDYTVTEAGFGAELGAEKFFDIKCRAAGLTPVAVVLVATVRALKYNGGAGREGAARPNDEALKKGLCNLTGHIENLKKYGIPVTVAVNRFITDSDAELALVAQAAEGLGVRAVVADAWGGGGKGCLDLAKEVILSADKGESNFKPLYPLKDSMREKIIKVATEIYGASSVSFSKSAEETLEFASKSERYRNLPVCIAKTQYSFSADKDILGRPTGFEMHVKDIVLRGGAEFAVVLMGDIMLMPGLPKMPNAVGMTIDEKRKITGLF